MLAMFAIIGAAAGCHGHDAAPPANGSAAPAVVAAADPCRPLFAHAEGQLRWIADDYAGALACAQSKQLPLVVDLWAPWCHTCLSMQTTVFTDPSFATERDKFVFVALDTDREANAAALGKLAISAWPTYYVLDDGEHVRARLVGSSSVPQFHAFLAAGTARGAGPEEQLVLAEQALAVKDLDHADQLFDAAFAALPMTFARRPEALGAWILTKLKRKDFMRCGKLALDEAKHTGNAAVASDFLGTATACADELAKSPANKELVASLRELAIDRWMHLLGDPAAQLSVDDRSDAMASLRETLDAVGKHGEAKAIAEEQRTLLDATAAKAPSALAAMTYNWPRAEVYVYLGKPLDLVPALEKSAKDLPHEYDPLARLGWLYWKAGKLPEAAKATDGALALVYGPRKGRVLSLRADIAAAAKDPAQRGFREQAVKLFESLPASQQNPDALAAAKAALAAIDAPATKTAAKP